MKNKFFSECADCDGTGDEGPSFTCRVCEGKGYVVTKEGEEIIEFLDRIKAVKD